MFFDQGLAALDFEARSAEDVIRCGGSLLLEAGDVRDDYCEHVLEREKVFPTGLVTPGLGVAMPHTDSEYVKRSQIAFISLKEPVNFKYMADKDMDVPVSIAFVIAMSQPHEQVKTLSNLSRAFEDPKVLESLHECSSVEELSRILADRGIS